MIVRASGSAPGLSGNNAMPGAIRPVLLMLCAALAATACKTSATVSSSATAAAEGLVKARIKGIEQVYARPDADLRAYDAVMLDPIEVSFSKNWKPRADGQTVSAAERQQIRDGLARILREEFTRELARSGRYRVVEAPAENVLRVKADIRDLIIHAPDLPRPGIVRTYTLSAGEMTLVAELRDAATGDLIARVIDHRRDPDSVWFELTTRIENIAAARRAAARWASILIEQLDAAHRLDGAR
ncbi:MAG: DUF3313 family protein [Pseudomonadota bacterium]